VEYIAQVPKCRLICPNSNFLRYFGVNTTWYLHHLVLHRFELFLQQLDLPLQTFHFIGVGLRLRRRWAGRQQPAYDVTRGQPCMPNCACWVVPLAGPLLPFARRNRETSQGNTLLLRSRPAGFICWSVRMIIGLSRPLPGYPTAPAFYPISIRQVRT